MITSCIFPTAYRHDLDLKWFKLCSLRSIMHFKDPIWRHWFAFPLWSAACVNISAPPTSAVWHPHLHSRAVRTTNVTQLTCFSTWSPMARLIFRYSVTGPSRMTSNASIAWDKPLQTHTDKLSASLKWNPKLNSRSLCSFFRFRKGTRLHRRRSRSLRSPRRWTPACWQTTSPGGSQLAPAAPSNRPWLQAYNTNADCSLLASPANKYNDLVCDSMDHNIKTCKRLIIIINILKLRLWCHTFD